MIVLAHAHVPLLVFFTCERHPTNERRWFIKASYSRPVVYLISITRQVKKMTYFVYYIPPVHEASTCLLEYWSVWAPQ